MGDNDISRTEPPVELAQEPPPNVLDRFMARINQPGFSEEQTKVKAFLICALSYNSPDDPNTSPLIREIGNVLGEFDPESPRRYGFSSRAGFTACYGNWPLDVKCIITLNGQDYMVQSSQGGGWSIREGYMRVSSVRREHNDYVAPINQLLILASLAETFKVTDPEMYLEINQVLELVRPVVYGFSHSRLRNVRLAIRGDGLQIAAYQGDGYYSPSGEPVNVEVSAGWTQVQV